MEQCKICEIDTGSYFNVNFKKIPLCEKCASLITVQHVEWLIRNKKQK